MALKYWYNYTGPVTPSSAYHFPSNYVKTTIPSGCNGGDTPCSIYAPATGSLTPASFSVKLINYINQAFVSGNNQPATGGKFYLYVKS